MIVKILILKTLLCSPRHISVPNELREMTHVRTQCTTGPTCICIKSRAKPTTEERITYSLLLVFEVSPELLQISRNWIPRQFQSLNDITSVSCLILSNERICKSLVKINLKDGKDKPLKKL